MMGVEDLRAILAKLDAVQQQAWGKAFARLDFTQDYATIRADLTETIRAITGDTYPMASVLAADFYGAVRAAAGIVDGFTPTMLTEYEDLLDAQAKAMAASTLQHAVDGHPDRILGDVAGWLTRFLSATATGTVEAISFEDPLRPEIRIRTSGSTCDYCKGIAAEMNGKAAKRAAQSHSYEQGVAAARRDAEGATRDAAWRTVKARNGSPTKWMKAFHNYCRCVAEPDFVHAAGQSPGTRLPRSVDELSDDELRAAMLNPNLSQAARYNARWLLRDRLKTMRSKLPALAITDADLLAEFAGIGKGRGGHSFGFGRRGKTEVPQGISVTDYVDGIRLAETHPEFGQKYLYGLNQVSVRAVEHNGVVYAIVADAPHGSSDFQWHHAYPVNGTSAEGHHVIYNKKDGARVERPLDRIALTRDYWDEVMKNGIPSD